MESLNNNTFIPLESHRLYLGTYDTVSKFSSCVISLISDRECQISMIESQNKTHTSTRIFTTVANEQFATIVNLTSPFVYFTVRNESLSSQTFLNFTVIYKTEFASTLPISKKVFNGSILNNGVSTSVESQKSTVVSVFGNSSVTGAITLQFSHDGIIWFSSQYVATLAVVGNFGFTIQSASRFHRLKWVGLTSTISAYVNVQ